MPAGWVTQVVPNLWGAPPNLWKRLWRFLQACKGAGRKQRAGSWERRRGTAGFPTKTGMEPWDCGVQDRTRTSGSCRPPLPRAEAPDNHGSSTSALPNLRNAKSSSQPGPVPARPRNPRNRGNEWRNRQEEPQPELPEVFHTGNQSLEHLRLGWMRLGAAWTGGRCP